MSEGKWLLIAGVLSFCFPDFMWGSIQVSHDIGLILSVLLIGFGCILMALEKKNAAASKSSGRPKETA